jgi:hypothetical protein
MKYLSPAFSYSSLLLLQKNKVATFIICLRDNAILWHLSVWTIIDDIILEGSKKLIGRY